MATVDQIRRYPLFADLREGELERVAPLLIRRTFAEGAYIFYPGNPGSNTYFVESGLVRMFMCTATGQQLLLNLAGPLEVFSFPLLDDEQFRIYGAVAHEPSVVLSLSREDFLRLMASSPRFMRNVYHELSLDVRRLLLHARSLATLDLNGRLAAMLIRLEQHREGQQARFEMPLSQEELASWIGASRGRLNRAMQRLQGMGLICVEGDEIAILDYAGLERLAEEQTMEEV